MNGLLCRAVILYSRAISPIFASLGCRCRFDPSCSEYASQALGLYPWWRAVSIIARRVVRCGPWCVGGPDPIPVLSKAAMKRWR